MGVDTSVTNELHSDYYKMDRNLHQMVEGIHKVEDEISQNLKEAEHIEQLLTKCLNEVEDLKQRELAIERLESKQESEGFSDDEKKLIREMFEELHQLAKDLDTARAALVSLEGQEGDVRENVTSLKEIDEKLSKGQEKLMNEEEGLLHRLEEMHPDYNAEVEQEWLTELERRYEDRD